MRFSGHESFQCRLYWPKKGVDFIQAKGDFNSPDAPMKLGVGKNMVISIRYWLKSFGLIDEDGKKLSELAKLLFKDGGWDPYLEDEGTLWLMHYQLVKCEYASSYDLIFNDLRKRRQEFHLDNLKSAVAQNGGSVADSSLKTDFSVFSRTYVPRDDSKDLDETHSGLLTELELVSRFRRENEENKKVEWLTIEPKMRSEIPSDILLYCILENDEYGNSISFDLLYNEGIGSIFAMTRDGLTEKLIEMAEKYSWINFSNEAGIRELQFSKKPEPSEALKHYYEV